MHRLFFLVLPFLFAACAVQNSMYSGAQTSTPVYKIEILWQIHTPYCGGAYPSPDQAMGWDTPNGNQEFVILMEPKIDPNKEYDLKVYRTDSDGIAKLELPKGTYYIFNSEKFESIEALEKKYKPTGGKWFKTRGERIDSISPVDGKLIASVMLQRKRITKPLS